MNQKLDQLQTKQKKIEHRIEQYEHRETILRNRMSYIKDGERKKRNHRLITRGAAVESIVPGVKGMNEPEFYELMETILNHPVIVPLLSKTGDDG